VEEWLNTYGVHFIYLMILLASLNEIAVIILTVSALAYKYDQISLATLIAIASVGSTCTNQILFLIGRKHGPRFIEKRPRLKESSAKVFDYLQNHGTLFILGFRFVIGRKASPIIIGASGFAIRRFAILNALGAVIWSVIYVSVGYLIGYYFVDSIEEAITSLGDYQRYIFIGVVIIAALIGLRIYYKKRTEV